VGGGGGGEMPVDSSRVDMARALQQVIYSSPFPANSKPPPPSSSFFLSHSRSQRSPRPRATRDIWTTTTYTRDIWTTTTYTRDIWTTTATEGDGDARNARVGRQGSPSGSAAEGKRRGGGGVRGGAEGLGQGGRSRRGEEFSADWSEEGTQAEDAEVLKEEEEEIVGIYGAVLASRRGLRAAGMAASIAYSEGESLSHELAQELGEFDDGNTRGEAWGQGGEGGVQGGEGAAASPDPPWMRAAVSPVERELGGGAGCFARAEVEEVVRAVGARRGMRASQERAVTHAIINSVTAIQGPPGTGKTFTTGCLIETLVNLRRRAMSARAASSSSPPTAASPESETRHVEGHDAILATAHSNAATDNLMDKLLSNNRLSVVRVGRATAVAPALRGHCLEALIDKTPGVIEVRKKLLLVDKVTASAQGLFQDLATERARATASILRHADVIVASLVGAGHDQLLASMREQRISFHTVVVDEATQAVEPACLIPLHQGAHRLVMVGDQCQLPPTVSSSEARKAGLGRSLFERLVAGGLPSELLTVQFRMHPALCDFSSINFYNGCLASYPSPESRPQPPGFPWPSEAPFAFVNVRHASIGDEECAPHSTSWRNLPEAVMVAQVVERFVAAGVPASGIGVMTPYSAQVSVLNDMVMDRLAISWPLAAGRVECSSVDAFQGREKEVTIISTVRSNQMSSLGFLTDWRRLNVAVTRARSGMVIVGDEQTLKADRYWGRLLELFDRKGALLQEHELGALFAAHPIKPRTDDVPGSEVNFLLD